MKISENIKRMLLRGIVLSINAGVWFWGFFSGFIMNLESALTGILAVSFTYLFAEFIYLNRKETVKVIVWNFLKFIQERVVFLLSAIGFIIMSAIYQNEINPATANTITLRNTNNPSQVIVFQQMAHIANKDFYNTIKEKIDNNAKLGFKVLYEQVKVDSMENAQKFDSYIGIKPTKETYTAIGKLMGDNITGQSNAFLLENSKNNINADVSAGEIVKHYENRQGTASSPQKSMTGVVEKEKAAKGQSDLHNASDKKMDEIVKSYESTFSNGLMKYIFQAMTNFMIKNNEYIMSIIFNKDSFMQTSVIAFRNDNLAKSVVNDPSQKKMILYGGAHFRGFLEELNKLQPGWEIANETSTKIL